MNMKQRIAFGAVVAAMLLGLVVVACQKPGPAEQTGKAVDNAVQKAGTQMEKVGNAIENAAKSEKK